MKKSVLTPLLLFVILNLFAQQKATVSGKVLDTGSEDPLPYATITIAAQEDQKLFAGAIADEEGRSVFEDVPVGNYTASFSFVGYETKEISLLIGELNHIYDLGKIRMEATGQELDEVSITAKREIVSSTLDKKSFDIEENISQSGGSVLDAMRNLPGITMNANLNWYRNDINSFSGTHLYPYRQLFQFEENSTYTWNFKANSNLQFAQGWDFQLTGVYYAPDIIPQGWIRDRYSLDFGLKRKIWNNKAEVWLSATDILNTFQIEREIKGENFDLTAFNYYETQVVTLGLKYKF